MASIETPAHAAVMDTAAANTYFSKIKNCRNTFADSKPDITTCIERQGVQVTRSTAVNLTSMLFLPYKIGALKECSDRLAQMAKKFETKEAVIHCFYISDSQTTAEGMLVFSPIGNKQWKLDKIKY